MRSYTAKFKFDTGFLFVEEFFGDNLDAFIVVPNGFDPLESYQGLTVARDRTPVHAVRSNPRCRRFGTGRTGCRIGFHTLSVILSWQAMRACRQ